MMATTKRTNPAAKAARRAAAARNPAVRKPANANAVAFAVATAFLPWYLPQAAYAQVTPPAPNTLPTGGYFVAGDGRILPATPQNYLLVQQETQRGIVNWSTFSIGSAGHVHFQNNFGAAGLTLNRVIGNDPSQIFGRLTGDGAIFLVNQNGVLFSRNSSVEVGSLFVSSLAIRDHDFMAGRYHFYRDGNAGSVVNEGTIVTANGYTALVGPQVRNDGLIIARSGSVALAAGDRVSLDLIGDGLISVNVDQAALNASVVNTGTIQADGGTVVLTARSANALLDTVINSSGVIRANSLVERNGEIILDGGSAGVVSVTGTLQAAGVDAGTTGGTIKILGDKVGLFGTARVDASGHSGGGTVLVGGNFQGLGPEHNATATFVGSGTSIDASAVASGNGGTVIVWSDNSTRVHGTISARGGAGVGNGGLIETSGHHLDVSGIRVDTRAPRGTTGTWPGSSTRSTSPSSTAPPAVARTGRLAASIPTSSCRMPLDPRSPTATSIRT
jgi:filamentous hemagglutinin family protein